MGDKDKPAVLQSHFPSRCQALKEKELPTSLIEHTPEPSSSLRTDNTRTFLLPCEFPQGIDGLGINLSISVPKDTPHGYISYQTDKNPPNLLALAILLECVLIQLANADSSI